VSDARLKDNGSGMGGAISELANRLDVQIYLSRAQELLASTELPHMTSPSDSPTRATSASASTRSRASLYGPFAFNIDSFRRTDQQRSVSSRQTRVGTQRPKLTTFSLSTQLLVIMPRSRV
jgi:hypothetical protein